MGPGLGVYHTGQAYWLLPDLHASSSPSAVITGWVKALGPKGRAGALVTYEKYVLEVNVNLPEGANAGGIRPGASMMLTTFMPGEQAAHVTGHYYDKGSAIWVYVDASRPMAVVGGLILAGWPAIKPYGHIGQGPVPPKLQTLLTRGTGLSMDMLDMVIDRLFLKHDQVYPKLFAGQPLRPILHTALASLIMYAEERVEHASSQSEEGRASLEALETAVNRVFGHSNNLRQQIFGWGRLIKEDFQNANHHLYRAESAPAVERLIVSNQQLASTVSNLHSVVQQQQREMAHQSQRVELLTDQISNANAKLDALLQADDQDGSTPAPPASRPHLPHPHVQPSPLPLPSSAPSPLPRPAQTPFSRLLQPPISSSSPSMSLSGKSAAMLYRELKAKGGVSSMIYKNAGDKGRAEVCFNFFDHLATVAEIKILEKPDAASGIDPDDLSLLGQRLVIQETLNKLVVERFRYAFEDCIREKGFYLVKEKELTKVPDALVKKQGGLPPTPPVGQVQERLNQLSRSGVHLENRDLRPWRRWYEDPNRGPDAVFSPPAREGSSLRSAAATSSPPDATSGGSAGASGKRTRTATEVSAAEGSSAVIDVDVGDVDVGACSDSAGPSSSAPAAPSCPLCQKLAHQGNTGGCFRHRCLGGSDSDDDEVFEQAAQIEKEYARQQAEQRAREPYS